MRTTTTKLTLLLPALACLGLAGCGHTLNGAKEDTDQAAQKTAAATDKAAAATTAAADKTGKAIAEAPRDIHAATAVTPSVKAAIVRDAVLNNPANVINVDSSEHVTHLTGHVQTASMKQRAAEDAQAILSKNYPQYKLANALTVSAPAR